MARFTISRSCSGTVGPWLHSSIPRTDSEVLLAGVCGMGDRCAARAQRHVRLRDLGPGDRELTLARDRFGVKPVYYAESRANVSVRLGKQGDSGPSARYRRDGCRRLAEYLTFQNFFTDRTLFAASKLLPPGCYMQIAPVGDEAPSRFDTGTSTFEEPERDLRAMRTMLTNSTSCFSQSVNRQLSAMSKSVHICPEAWIPVRSPLWPPRNCPICRTFTVGFDLNSASGVETGFRRARGGRVHVLPVQDRAL